MSKEGNQGKGAVEIAAPSSTKKAAPTVVVTNTSKPTTSPTEALGEQAIAKIRAEERAKLETEMKAKFVAEQEKALAEKAGEEQKVADDETTDKIRESLSNEATASVAVDRIVVIQPASVAKDTAKMGELLPNVNRGYGAFKNAFGKYQTGFTDEELKQFKNLPVWDKEREQPNEAFWRDYLVSLTSAKKELHIDKSERHLIDYRLLLDHPEIANSESQLTSRTLFYIEDPEAEAEVQNRELDYLTDALIAIKKMSPSERRAFLSLFGEETRSISDNVVVSRLKTYAEQDPKTFVSNFEDGNKKDKILISEMVENNVLQKRDGAFWFNEHLLGTDFDTTVYWMSQARNQDVKIRLMQKLEINKRR